MLESEGKKELTGIARSIDVIFARIEGAASSIDAVEESSSADTVVIPPPLPEPVEEPVEEFAPDAAATFEAIPEPEAPADEWVAEPPAVEMVEPAAEVPPPVAEPSTPTSVEDGGEAAPTELDLAVDAYLEGDRQRASEIERIGQEMVERRELDPVARAVVRLTVAAGDPPDASVYAVTESIMQPIVLEHVVRRLGSERVEEARREYYGACRTIGEPMARALREGLGDTSTDRLARRNYCDALLSMGDASRPTIEAMAVDENRFLARNAIAMLGEMGGASALELVTPALANPDARVRREALRSLAKIGDAESGSKLMELGLLNDSDDEVRIAAATTAGELRVSRAVKPLIAMLDETKDPDRAIPLIRALGLLEDPGAVPSIEKWAVPTLFFKARTDARIAAYRALYSIGTPHAVKLLAKASSDKDSAVQSAVMGMRRSDQKTRPNAGSDEA